MDRRIVAVLAVAVVIVPTALAVRAVLASEAFNTPRVIAADGRIVASAASELREPRSVATLLWAALPDDAPKVNEISWNGRVVRVTLDGRTLNVGLGNIAPMVIDISRLDYARQVYGLTATVDGGTAEWLALLVRLRDTGRRELFVLFDANGALVYEELFERRTGLKETPVLWSIGSKGQRQQIVIDLGSPIRFAIRQ